jgi:hypothetical protein
MKNKLVYVIMINETVCIHVGVGVQRTSVS